MPSDTRISVSEEQINRIMDAIHSSSRRIEDVNNSVSEVKGTVAAFLTGLAEERKAREALGHKVDRHDEILRGDGTPKNPGLVEQVGDVRQIAEDAIKGVHQIRVAIWTIGSPIAIAIVLDAIFRILPMIYGTH